RAGSVGDDLVVPGELVMVDAEDDGQIGAVGGRGNKDALGARGEMRRSLVLWGENAGAFHRNVDAEILPGQLRRIALGRDLDRPVSATDRVSFDGHLAGEAAVHAVVAQQVRVGFNRTEVVDANDFNVLATGFGNGAKDIAPDAPKPVNANTDCHELLPA